MGSMKIAQASFGKWLWSWNKEECYLQPQPTDTWLQTWLIFHPSPTSRVGGAVMEGRDVVRSHKTLCLLFLLVPLTSSTRQCSGAAAGKMYPGARLLSCELEVTASSF